MIPPAFLLLTGAVLFVLSIVSGAVLPARKPALEDVNDEPEAVVRAAFRHLRLWHVSVFFGSAACVVFMFVAIPRTKVERYVIPGGSLISQEERQWARESDNLMYSLALEQVHADTYEPPRMVEVRTDLGGSGEAVVLWLSSAIALLGAALGLALYRMRCRSVLFSEVLVPRWQGAPETMLGAAGPLGKKFRILGRDGSNGALRCAVLAGRSRKKMFALARAQGIEPVVWTQLSDLFHAWRIAG